MASQSNVFSLGAIGTLGRIVIAVAATVRPPGIFGGEYTVATWANPDAEFPDINKYHLGHHKI